MQHMHHSSAHKVSCELQSHAGTWPKRQDLPHIAALGVCLFFNQLLYIIGISLSGVLVATCMQPTIPVFTAMLAVLLKLESGSIQKFLGIGMAVVGSMSMVRSASLRSSRDSHTFFQHTNPDGCLMCYGFVSEEACNSPYIASLCCCLSGVKLEESIWLLLYRHVLTQDLGLSVLEGAV